MSDLTCTIRCASPDNNSQIRDLIELFRTLYGDQYPNLAVYREAYWRSHLLRSFTSVVLYHGREMVGHIAYKLDPHDPRMVQIFHTLVRLNGSIDPTEVAISLAASIESQAERQDWRGVYCASCVDLGHGQTLFEQAMGVSAVALTQANLYRLGAKNRTPSEMRVMTRLFKPEDDKRRTVYVSADRAAWVSDVYRSMGLVREIRSEIDPEKAKQFPISADRMAIERHRLRGVNLEYLFVEPTLLRRNADLVDRLRSGAENQQVVLVKAYDPQAISCEHLLSEEGFEFAGVVPFVWGRESLVFSRSPYAKSSKDGKKKLPLEGEESLYGLPSHPRDAATYSRK